MKIDSTNRNCSFKSKIVVTDFDTFLRYLKNLPDKTRASETIVKGKNVYTGGLSTCNGGGAGNGKEGCAFHYCRPERAELTDIHEGVKSLETDDNSPHILITGGLDIDDISRFYFNKVLEKLGEFRKNISIIWGQKIARRKDETILERLKQDSLPNYTNIYYSAETDTWIFNHRGDKEIRTLQDLKDTYEIIDIAPGDELWIGGQRIDPELLK